MHQQGTVRACTTARPYQLLSQSHTQMCSCVARLHPGDAAESDAVDPAVLELEIQEQVKAAVAVVAEMQLVLEQLKVGFRRGCPQPGSPMCPGIEPRMARFGCVLGRLSIVGYVSAHLDAAPAACWCWSKCMGDAARRRCQACLVWERTVSAQGAGAGQSCSGGQQSNSSESNLSNWAKLARVLLANGL